MHCQVVLPHIEQEECQPGHDKIKTSITLSGFLPCSVRCHTKKLTLYSHCNARAIFLLNLSTHQFYLPLQRTGICASKPKKYKNTLLQFILIYFIWRSIYQSTIILFTCVCLSWGRYPKGIDNPFNRSGCGYLLYVCMCRSRIVA